MGKKEHKQQPNQPGCLLGNKSRDERAIYL